MAVDRTATGFRSKLGAILFLTLIFYINFTARVVLAPLLPKIVRDLGLGAAEAGSLFFMISIGYCVSLAGSGFLSAKISHRKTVVVSGLIGGIGLLMAGTTDGMTGLRVALFVVGLGGGLYLPSAIAVITGLVKPANWGKAIAIHEVAPNLSLLTAPLLAELFLSVASWRAILLVGGICSIGIGLAYTVWGRGGDERGQAPRPEVIRTLAANPSFWIMAVLFALGVAGEMGVYAMLPLYLVNEGGLERTFANSLIAVSRVTGLIMAFTSGWITDRFGERRALAWIFAVMGVVTISLGLLQGTGLMIMVFLQAALPACFFPPGFAALARIVPPEDRNVAVALAVPLAILGGSGGVPVAIGYFGETWSLSAGFISVGVIILAGTFLVRLIRYQGD